MRYAAIGLVNGLVFQTLIQNVDEVFRGTIGFGWLDTCLTGCLSVGVFDPLLTGSGASRLGVGRNLATTRR